jgi:hypothetical protein
LEKKKKGKRKKKKPWCSLRLCNFFNKKNSDKKIEKILEILCFSILNLTNISLFYAKNSPNVLYQNFEGKKIFLKKNIFFLFFKTQCQLRLCDFYLFLNSFAVGCVNC